MKIQLIILGILGLLLLLIGVGSLMCFTVNEKEYVILTEFGKTVRLLDEPGLHFKKPGFWQTVNRLDKRLHIFKTKPMQIMTQGKQQVIIACLICWRIADPELFFKTEKHVKKANKDLSDMINDQLGSVLGQYPLENVINVEEEKVRLDEIENKILLNSQPKAKSKYGVEIVRVGVRRLAYPANVEESVYQRMIAEREKEAKKYRAEGRKEAMEIESKTDAEVRRILAEAYRDAQMKRGDADKEAMRIYAEAYGQDKEFFEFLKSLDLYKQTLQENTTLILSTDSPMFKQLNYMESKGDQ